MSRIAEMVENDPEAYERLRSDSRAHIVSTYDWNKVLDGLTRISGSVPVRSDKDSVISPFRTSRPAQEPDTVGV